MRHLALCLAIAGCDAATSTRPTAATTPAGQGSAAPAPRATLAMVRVDDTIDPFAGMSDDALPAGEGISLAQESTSLGPGKAGHTRFARIVLREGESRVSAQGRLSRWLEAVRLPAGVRWGFEDVAEVDPARGRTVVVGLRSFLMTGESALSTDDVADASVNEDKNLGGAGPTRSQAYVALTLTPSGAARLEALTRDWIGRRAAIIIDGDIRVTPVIRSAIAGGRASITVDNRDEADQLAKRLRGR